MGDQKRKTDSTSSMILTFFGLVWIGLDGTMLVLLIEPNISSGRIDYGLLGRTRRFTYTDCRFKIDRIYDKYGHYKRSCLTARGQKITRFANIHDSVDEDRLH